MSLYIKEKPEFFDECMKSILSNTVLPNEIVIVLDGPISDELRQVLDKYVNDNPSLYNIVPLETNQGLGLALREGVLHCNNELIARMDTDDICRKDRFELQLKEFENNPDLDICGSHIKEFENDQTNIVSVRKVPLDNKSIRNYQKKRSSFNHMTVMYKKSAVIKAGNYEHCPLMEDDLLWIKMLLSESQGCNIDDYLVDVRVGDSMIKRRGGLSYFKKYKKARKRILKTGFINRFQYFVSVFVQLIVSLLPIKIRKAFFKKVLRTKQ